MPIKARFYVIFGERRLTKLMQAADVFEKSKVLGKLQTWEVLFKEEEKKVTYAQCERLIDKLIKNQPKEYIISLIHLHSIIDGDRVWLNEEQKCEPYINKSVRVISDGNHWRMFHEFLRNLGIKIEIDQHCFIK